MILQKKLIENIKYNFLYDVLLSGNSTLNIRQVFGLNGSRCKLLSLFTFIVFDNRKCIVKQDIRAMNFITL